MRVQARDLLEINVIEYARVSNKLNGWMGCIIDSVIECVK